MILRQGWYLGLSFCLAATSAHSRSRMDFAMAVPSILVATIVAVVEEKFRLWSNNGCKTRRTGGEEPATDTEAKFNRRLLSERQSAYMKWAAGRGGGAVGIVAPKADTGDTGETPEHVWRRVCLDLDDFVREGVCACGWVKM